MFCIAVAYLLLAGLYKLNKNTIIHYVGEFFFKSFSAGVRKSLLKMMSSFSTTVYLQKLNSLPIIAERVLLTL